MKKRRLKDFSIIDSPLQTEIERNKLIKTIFLSLAGIFLVLSLIIAGYSSYKLTKLTNTLPDVSILKVHKPDQTTLIYDINDHLIANIHGDEDRVLVPLSKISPYVQRAVVAIEDNRFYDHNGVDLMGTLRAGLINAVSNGYAVQGGSTLTQQLVKNSFLSPEKSMQRKLIEAVLAVEVEKNYTKNQILEMYLNQIYWGNRSYGIEKAARRYFKKPAKDLNLAESALLAGLIRAPEAYSPYTNLKGAKLRQKLVLERMEHYGYITANQRTAAQNQKLTFSNKKENYSKYPYFIDYVSYLLRRTYGEDVVRRGGLRVYTTLDPAVQEIAEKTITEGVKLQPGGSGIRQGALVSIKVENGYVQALVGGIDYEQSNYNRAVFAKRAAGSSFKPVVYLTGLRLGKITPDSPIVDAPISFNTGWNIWSPHNWDGKYMGQLTVRKALTYSRNTPTVRVALKVGLDPIIETARMLGIKSHINRNLSIVLGSTGVSPLELATVFSTLAREGTYVEPIAIRRVEDSDHNILEQNQPNPLQVVSPNFVRELNSILIDVVEKGTGKNAKLDDRVVAGKTGTTDDVKDIWFSGFTPDTATVIWMGNDENTKLNGVFSSNCAQLWQAFSKQYYKVKDIPPRPFNLPDKPAVKKDNKPDEKPDNKHSNKSKNKPDDGLTAHPTKNKSDDDYEKAYFPDTSEEKSYKKKKAKHNTVKPNLEKIKPEKTKSEKKPEKPKNVQKKAGVQEPILKNLPETDKAKEPNYATPPVPSSAPVNENEQ